MDKAKRQYSLVSLKGSIKRRDEVVKEVRRKFLAFDEFCRACKLEMSIRGELLLVRDEKGLDGKKREVMYGIDYRPDFESNQWGWNIVAEETWDDDRPNEAIYSKPFAAAPIELQMEAGKLILKLIRRTQRVIEKEVGSLEKALSKASAKLEELKAAGVEEMMKEAYKKS